MAVSPADERCETVLRHREGVKTKMESHSNLRIDLELRSI